MTKYEASLRQMLQNRQIFYSPFLLTASLLLLTVLVYIPTMKNGFIWDDPQYVVDNPTLKSADGLWQIWTDTSATPQYYPMVHSTFWMESRFTGTQRAILFHIDNILLHAMAAVLLWRALASLDIPAAWLAAAIFAVHPVMVESVTWVTERKNVLSIVFYLLAFLAYRCCGLLDRNLFKRGWYIAALFLFVLALLSKTVTCSFPAAILLILWWKHGSIAWRDIKPLLPMLIIGLILSGITSHLEQTQVGARGPDFAWTPIDRCLIAGHAICFYAGKIVWPHPLMFMYPHWDLHVDRAVQFVYPAIVTVVVLTLWFARKNIGRGPLTAVLFFIGTLTPALGFVNVYPMRYSFVADHFQYLASIGLITLIAVGLNRISKLTAIVLLPLMWITVRQQAIYQDAKTLWQNTIAQNPTCWMAHTNLAGVLRAAKDKDAALQESRIALALAPNEADTHYDFGTAQAEHSNWDAAIEQYKLAIQCDPQCAPAWSDMSRLIWDHHDSPKDQSDALNAARQALAIRPNQGNAMYVLARVAEISNDLPHAVENFEKALLVNDEDFESHFELGNCQLQLGHADKAIHEYQRVLDHNDKNAMAQTNMGYAQLALGKTGQAVQSFQRALSLNPDLDLAKQGLAKTGKS